jgi:hypothetical protein
MACYGDSFTFFIVIVVLYTLWECSSIIKMKTPFDVHPDIKRKIKLGKYHSVQNI